MKAIKTLAIGTVGVAALVGAAAPASAQYYGYPGYGYNNNPVNVVGQVLQSVLNPYANNRYAYAMSPQMAAQRCSAAVQQRLQRSYAAGYGYNPYSAARVVNITRVEPRSRTTTRVRGLATSGMNYGPYGYGAYGAVGYGYAAPADLSFRCDIDYRGYIRDIDIDRRR